MNNFKYLLKKIHSFSLDYRANKIIKICYLKNLINIYDYLRLNKINYIIIGNGTNTIFANNFNGYVLINKIFGFKIKEYKNFWLIKLNSGENWSEFVKFTIKNNIFGLENLAMIPGQIGSSAMHNIGAFGSEFKDFCYYVDIINLNNRKIIRLNNKKCKFSYRNSLLKNLKNNYFILSVCLKINKKWKPNLSYHIFKNNFFKKNINPKKIFDFIVNTRNKNIPNPKIFGNSGSIFKNCIINFKKLKKIINNYNDIPYIYEKKNFFRVYSGWLIEKCNLKGFIFKNLIISNKNSLIILNNGNSNGKELISLIKIIYNNVIIKFNIKLKLEISLIYNNKKIKINDLIH